MLLLFDRVTLAGDPKVGDSKHGVYVAEGLSQGLAIVEISRDNLTGAGRRAVTVRSMQRQLQHAPASAMAESARCRRQRCLTSSSHLHARLLQGLGGEAGCVAGQGTHVPAAAFQEHPDDAAALPPGRARDCRQPHPRSCELLAQGALPRPWCQGRVREAERARPTVRCSGCDWPREERSAPLRWCS